MTTAHDNKLFFDGWKDKKAWVTDTKRILKRM